MVKPFSQFLCESIHPNMVEYITRLIFKGKSLDAAVNATHKKFNGFVNPFLGGLVSVTKDELKNAYLNDKRQTLKAQWDRTPEERRAKAIEVFCDYFKVTPEQMHIDEAFVSPNSNTRSEDGYMYHATNEENAESIAASGLKCFPPHHGTDQSCWPDGKRDKRLYVTPSANKTWMFAPEDGRSVVLRIKRTAAPFKAEVGTGDWYSTTSIPAKYIEIQTDTGWVDLTAAF